jgi:hypothetical protein
MVLKRDKHIAFLRRGLFATAGVSPVRKNDPNGVAEFRLVLTTLPATCWVNFSHLAGTTRLSTMGSLLVLARVDSVG